MSGPACFEPRRSAASWRDRFEMYRALRDRNPAHYVESADVVKELFEPLPSLVVAHFLGVPAEERGHFVRRFESLPFHANGGP